MIKDRNTRFSTDMMILKGTVHCDCAHVEHRVRCTRQYVTQDRVYTEINRLM